MKKVLLTEYEIQLLKNVIDNAISYGFCNYDHYDEINDLDIEKVTKKDLINLLERIEMSENMQESLTIEAKLENDTSLPAYSRDGDAALDLRSTIKTVIPPQTTMLIPTGVKLAIPKGYFGLVACRSGIALKDDIGAINGVGIIDSNYRGDIGAILHNYGDDPYYIEKGDRIVQIIIIKIPKINLKTVTQLSESNRDENGFGSSGKQ